MHLFAVCAIAPAHGTAPHLQRLRSAASDSRRRQLAAAATSEELGVAWLCNQSACEETNIFLASEPAEADGVVCELQNGLTFGDGSPVWACGKVGPNSPLLSHNPTPPPPPKPVAGRSAPPRMLHAASAAPSRMQSPALSTRSRRLAAAADDGELAPRSVAAAAVAGLGSNAVMWASLYSVATTGGGLPAGPFGVVGLVEGVSYLLVVGLAGAALYSKVSTGSGLPAGPGGLLGAAEGLSCLSVAAGAAVLLLLQANQGCVPNALPLADYSDRVAVCR